MLPFPMLLPVYATPNAFCLNSTMSPDCLMRVDSNAGLQNHVCHVHFLKARSEMEATHLQLQNVLYEHLHVLTEIKKCQSYRCGSLHHDSVRVCVISLGNCWFDTSDPVGCAFQVSCRGP